MQMPKYSGYTERPPPFMDTPRDGIVIMVNQLLSDVRTEFGYLLLGVRVIVTDFWHRVMRGPTPQEVFLQMVRGDAIIPQPIYPIPLYPYTFNLVSLFNTNCPILIFHSPPPRLDDLRL